MNKQDLIVKSAEIADVSQKDASAVIDAIFGAQGKNGIIVDATAAGDKVELVGFGGFSKRNRAARMGRNPQTGAEVTIAASTVPAFKPGKRYKDGVK